MRYYFFIISFCIATFAAAAQAAPTAPLRVLFLNFNSEDVIADSPAAALREARLQAIKQYIRDNDIDVILLVEAWNFRKDPSVAITLGRELGYDYTYRLGLGFPGVVYDSNAILAKKKFIMSGAQYRVLPHSTKPIGNGTTWTISPGRVSFIVGAKLTLDDGTPLLIYATHLIGVNEQQRADQARAVTQDFIQMMNQLIKESGLNDADPNVIIGGDFNSAPDSPTIAIMRGAGLHDSWGDLNPGDQRCTSCNDPLSEEFNPITVGAGLYPPQLDPSPNYRIDNIFYRGPRLHARVGRIEFSEPYHGLWMSDHSGLFAEFGDGPVEKDVPPSSREPKSTILTLTDSLFACPWPDHCQNGFHNLIVPGMRGLTVMNQTGGSVSVHMYGPYRTLPARDVCLQKGQLSAFVFPVSGLYNFLIRDDLGNQLSGYIEAHLPNK